MTSMYLSFLRQYLDDSDADWENFCKFCEQELGNRALAREILRALNRAIDSF